MHFYFFVSTCKEDNVNRLTIISSNILRAYALAFNYFTKHNCKGEPTILAI